MYSNWIFFFVLLVRDFCGKGELDALKYQYPFDRKPNNEVISNHIRSQ